MEFKDALKNYINRIETLKDTVATEESTKMALIIPFFQILGYDVFNPLEFCPEYIADVGIKKGEKVDYAILIDGKPVILIEAKAANKALDKHSSQLFRYFVATSAKFAILTNGIAYKFYTDLDDANKMDKEPFLDINLLNIKEYQIQQLSKFQRNSLNVSEIMDSASLLKYNSLFKATIEREFQNPTDEMVKLFLQPIYKGAKTQSVIEKFRPILKKALNDYLTENLNEKLQIALSTTNTISTSEPESVSTNEEWEAFSIIKEALKDILDINKLFIKHTESYAAFLYENNSRKWICRLILNTSQKTLILPDENKKELKYPLTDIQDIRQYTEKLSAVGKRYLYIPTPTIKEILCTKWGNYEMPSPYSVNLLRGPRNDLKKI